MDCTYDALKVLRTVWALARFIGGDFTIFVRCWAISEID